VEQAVQRLIADRADTQEHAVVRAEAIALARKVDQLSAPGVAGTALPGISRRLEERLEALEPQVPDALDELRAARARRLANPDTDRSGSSPAVHHVGHGS
jgi:hypothetical protein